MNWVDDLNNSADVGQVYQFQPVKRQPQQTNKKKGGRGGFLTSLISEGGAIGGGAAGATAGSAILPGIGTLIGGALGAGIGAFTGRTAENKVRDDRWGLGDAAKEGALSAVLGGGPLRLGKAAVETAKGVKAGVGLADALKAGGKAGADMSIARSLGGKLSDSGQKLTAKEFRLNPTQQSNFAKLHGEEATSVLRRYGVKSPEDIQTKLQPLQNAFDSVVTSIPAVGKSELETGLKKVYEPLLKSPALFEQGLGQQVKSQADELLKLAKNGSLPADKVNEIRKTFDSAVSYTQKGAPEYNVIKKTADALRSTLQSAADKSGVKTAEGMSFKDIGKELRKLYGLEEIVGKQSYLGSGSLPFSLPNLLGGATGGAAGGLPGAAAGTAVTAIANSNLGRRALTNGTLKAGEKLTEKGTANADRAFTLGGVAKRVAPVSIAQALADQSSASNIQQPMDTTAMTNTNSITEPVYQNTDQMSTQQVASSPFDIANVSANVERLAASGASAKDIEGYLSIASALQSMQMDAAKSSGNGLNSTQLQQANNAQSGLDSLSTIAQTLQQDPSAAKKAALPGGSFTQALTGTGQYQAAINNATDVIGRLRSGGAINADEEKRFRSLLPAAFDSEDTVQYKLNSLAQLFQRFTNPQSAQPDVSGIAAALGM